jgi:hypothetical protein
MKHLIRFESYSEQDRLNDILSKILKYGEGSLTDLEKRFLQSWSTNTEKQVHDEIGKIETEQIFEDDNGYFKFEFKEWEDYGDEHHFIGTFYVPDLELENGKKVVGILEGKIVKFENGTVSPDFFNKDGYDIFEFCNGLEYELDGFIDYIIQEIEEKYKSID